MLSGFRRFVIPVLAAGAVGFTVAAAVNPLFTTPALAGTALPVVTSTTSFSFSASSDTLLRHAGAKAASQALAAREHRAAHRRWLAARRRAARKAAAALAAQSAHQAVTQQAAPPAAVSAPSGVLSAAEVGRLWISAGGPASQEGVAECVAYAESQDNPAAINPNDNYGTQTSVGLFQLSTGSHAYPASWTTAAGNAAGAVAKYDASGWSPWTTAPGCGG